MAEQIGATTPIRPFQSAALKTAAQVASIRISPGSSAEPERHEKALMASGRRLTIFT